MMYSMTSDLAQTKALRRRTLRDTFPYPLNQIALRHVDSIAALDDTQRSILCRAVQKTELRYAATFVNALNKNGDHIQNEDDLVTLLPPPPRKEAQSPIDCPVAGEIDPAGTGYLANLLMKCYPDMPPASADALARAEVMETSLRVVQATRNALHEANSDFVVVTLFTLFEEQLNELRELINRNPAFTKAILLSRPDWK